MEELNDEVKVEERPEVKPKPKTHIWNQILEDDELSEKLAASMNKLGDEFARRFIRKKRNRKNKKKKKGKNDDTQANGNPNVDGCSNGTTNQVKTSKPEVKKVVAGQSKSKPQQQSNQLKRKWNNQRQGESSKKKERLSNHVLTAEAQTISKKLKEKRVDLIIRTIRFLGLDEAMKLCSEVLTIEEAGGLMTMNGTRRRTPGGIFFHLIRSSGRYDATTVSKLFKEGDNKEPVFKSRNKSRIAPSGSIVVSSAPMVNVTNAEKIEQTIDLNAQQLPQHHPEPSTSQIIKPEDLKPLDSVANVDIKMEEEDDGDDNPNLVIVETDSNSLDLNISCQQPPSIKMEPHSMITPNVTLFTANRISVDA